MNRLSGAQTGRAAFSVPASGCAVNESIGRTHKRVLPAVSRAVNASGRASGDIATLVARRPLLVTKRVFSGASTKNRTTRGVAERVRYAAAKPTTVVNASNPTAAFQRMADVPHLSAAPATSGTGVDAIA